MSLTKHTNGYYYIREQVNGKKIKFSLKTKKKHEAEAIYQFYLFQKYQKQILSIPQIQSYIIEGTSGIIPGFMHHQDESSIPVKRNDPIKHTYLEYIDLARIKGLSKSTLNMKNLTLKLLLRNEIKDFFDFDQDHINRLVDKLSKTYSNDTMRKIIAEIKAFLNHAIRKLKFSRSTYETLVFPSYQTSSRDVTIKEEDFQKMMDILEETGRIDFKRYLDFLWYTGCRPGEALRVKVSDIDIETRSISVYQTKTRNMKVIIIPRDKVQEIQEMMDKPYGEYIFKGIEQGPEYYGKQFSRFKKKYGFAKDYNLYTYRHSFGTRLINKTGDIELVSRALGHSDISITAKHYINRSLEERKRKMDEAF